MYYINKKYKPEFSVTIEFYYNQLKTVLKCIYIFQKKYFVYKKFYV